MMQSTETLQASLLKTFPALKDHIVCSKGELTVGVVPEKIVEIMQILHKTKALAFDTLIDLCGVDYLHYGCADWQTDNATATGFSRAREADDFVSETWPHSRFAVVYHLLSTKHNHRLRVKAFLPETNLKVASVHTVWKGAAWFEREAYDLFGILFENHPDLRRILTDYGFIGHPFRKDFPLSGHVEVRYDAHTGQVIYEPVDIEPRVTVPRVIRHDSRYLAEEGEGA